MSEDKSQSAGAGENDEKKALTLLNESADGGMHDGEMDSSKVKFINGGTADPNSDAKVEMGGDSGKNDEFVGLTKEELMKYANDPHWVRVRWVLLILFWVAWFAMLAAAIIIIVVAPRCPHRPDLMWWQKEVAYKVYPRSFQDSDGDGVGDLSGIHSRLNHVKNELHADTILLNSIYKSPGADLGYDISDFKAIDPLFGTMEDFDDLRLAIHNKGMHLVMDFVPNHSSKDHDWFQASRNNKSDDNPYLDYYVWADGKGSGPPNNWRSVYGGSAWTKDDKRGQWYLHQFLPEQPDLNLRSEKVQDELKSILRFWLDKKVDGFHIRNLAHLFETNDTTKDEARNPNVTDAQPDDYNYYDHKYTAFQPETYEITAKWREVLDTYYSDGRGYRFLVGDVEGTPEQVMPFYKKGVDIPLNRGLTKLKKGCGGRCVGDLVNSWMDHKSKDEWDNWVLGDDSTSRISTRLGEEYVNAANMLTLLLPGTATAYYGDEIGMVDGVIDSEDAKDPIAENNNDFESRDPERTPMQWNSSAFAGFTAGEPWLPVNKDFNTRNVEMELAHGTGGISTLEVFKNVSKLRTEPSFSWGTHKEAVVGSNIYSFVRHADGFEGFLVVINFGTEEKLVNFQGRSNIPTEGTIVANTANFDPDRATLYMLGTKVHLSRGLFLKPGEGVVFKWPADALK